MSQHVLLVGTALSLLLIPLKVALWINKSLNTNRFSKSINATNASVLEGGYLDVQEEIAIDTALVVRPQIVTSARRSLGNQFVTYDNLCTAEYCARFDALEVTPGPCSIQVCALKLMGMSLQPYLYTIIICHQIH